ncbi:hypothetical protein DW228_06310 [Bacteroides fragilis]|uniref:Uncharacterized protein n=1 Tax=Bacteroides fragilis TaxID=817 RepID=A0A396C805_BACFG|nr:hypothetical protein DW228_06310 [Bacteroides fragilis]
MNNETIVTGRIVQFRKFLEEGDDKVLILVLDDYGLETERCLVKLLFTRMNLEHVSTDLIPAEDENLSRIKYYVPMTRHLCRPKRRKIICATGIVVRIASEALFQKYRMTLRHRRRVLNCSGHSGTTESLANISNTPKRTYDSK